MDFGIFTIADGASLNGGNLCVVDDISNNYNVYGTVYEDENGNQLQDINEKGAAGIQVNIIDSNENITTVFTDNKGDYNTAINIPEGEEKEKETTPKEDASEKCATTRLESTRRPRYLI